ARTIIKRRSRSSGLYMKKLAPAWNPRTMAAGRVSSLIITTGVMRLRLESRICRVSSGPSGKGIWSSRKTIANLPCWRMSEASALRVTLKESMPTEPRTFSMRWQVAGSSSTISARLSMLTLLSKGRSAQCHGVQEITVHDERACLEEILEQDANRRSEERRVGKEMKV